ncbi:MAG: trypsin, partial [Clostridiales bacterium]|nr:trypsin [Clostridiales bacterium]
MKRKRIWAHFLLAAMIFFVFTTCSTTVCIGAAANADGIDDDKTLSPYFFVEGTGGSADSFPLKETRVAANVNGVIADVYVTQTYANQGSKPINASYVFPASSKVSVHGMKMEIGDK